MDAGCVIRSLNFTPVDCALRHAGSIVHLLRLGWG